MVNDRIVGVPQLLPGAPFLVLYADAGPGSVNSNAAPRGAAGR